MKAKGVKIEKHKVYLKYFEQEIVELGKCLIEIN